MTKTKYIYIFSMTLLILIGFIGINHTLVTLIDPNVLIADSSNIGQIVAQLFPYMLYLIALIVIVVYIRFYSPWLTQVPKVDVRLYISFTMMAFASVRVVEFPFRGIKLLMTGLILEENVIAQTQLLSDYFLSLILLVPFIIGYREVLKRYGVWYIQQLEVDKIVFAYIVIHGMFVTYFFGVLQKVLTKFTSSEPLVVEFLWIEMIQIVSVTTVIAAIMWGVLNGLKSSYTHETGREMVFADYKGYIGITLVFSYMFSLFALPNAFQSIAQAYASGDLAYINFIVENKVVEIGIPLLAVLLGMVWIKQDPTDFAKVIDHEEDCLD